MRLDEEDEEGEGEAKRRRPPPPPALSAEEAAELTRQATACVPRLGSLDEATVGAALSELEGIAARMTVQVLADSGAGKAVNKVKKSGAAALQPRARALIDAWKALAAS